MIVNFSFFNIFVLLKKLISILFFFIFLSANTVFGQLLKLPVLIEHYYEHQDDRTDDDHGISFLDFLKKHYTSNNSNTGDTKHSHENLPFKNTNCTSVNSISVLPQHIFFKTITPFICLKKYQPLYNQSSYISTQLGSIWQPPRLS